MKVDDIMLIRGKLLFEYIHMYMGTASVVDVIYFFANINPCGVLNVIFSYNLHQK